MLQEYKYYTECMRAIIWTNDARIIGDSQKLCMQDETGAHWVKL